MKAVRVLGVALIVVMALVAGSTANIHGNSFGNPKAPVTIEVFSDFQCPACKAFHDTEFQQIMTDYVIPGKVYLIYRYFPLKGHEFGRASAEFVCAASRVDRYQKVADALFANQAAIANHSTTVEYIGSSVLTPTEAKTVQSLLKSPDVQRQIDTDVEEGTKVPVAYTPTFWVTAHGSSQVVSWPLDYRLFKQYMDSLLAK